MDISEKLALLYEKDTSQAYACLQELEALSEREGTLYEHFDVFLSMLSSEKYVVRVRGFRLICKQARWDTQDKLNKNIDTILLILGDERPTAVRQALKALEYVVVYKKELHEIIRNKAMAIDPLIYKDTMHSLLQKDVRSLLAAMGSIE